MTGNSDFLFSMAFGGLIIIFFAWDRFKQPSYLNDLGSMRLIELLAPNDLRRGNIYFRAYALYVSGLLAAYVIFCFYSDLLAPPLADYFGISEINNQVGGSSLPVNVEQVGFPEADPVTKLAAPESERNPDFPLYVSLVIVGLVPTFPGFKKLEERLRFAAHRMSGIPTRIMQGRDRLKHTPLLLPDSDEGFLISTQDWERMQHYRAMAHGKITEMDAFDEDMVKIIAFQSWILREKFEIARQRTGHGIFDLFVELGKRTDQLLSSLDALTGFGDYAAPKTDKISADNQRTKWDALAKEADALCDDYCILIMLLAEHGSMPWDQGQGIVFSAVEAEEEEVGVHGDFRRTQDDDLHQRSSALAIFRDYARKADQFVDDGTVTYMLWVRTTLICASVAFTWGLVFGDYSGTSYTASGPIAQFGLGVQYGINALLTYSLSLLVCLSYHQSAYRSRNWNNVFRSSWARWVPQLAFVFVLSLLVSMICLVAYNVTYVITVQADTLGARNEWYKLIPAQINRSIPLSLPAPFLGICTILAFDLWLTRKATDPLLRTTKSESDREVSRTLPSWLMPTRNKLLLISAVAMMFLVGVVSRGGAIQVSDVIYFSANELPYEHTSIWDLTFKATTPLVCPEGIEFRTPGCAWDLTVLKAGLLAATICLFSMMLTQATLPAYFQHLNAKAERPIFRRGGEQKDEPAGDAQDREAAL